MPAENRTSAAGAQRLKRVFNHDIATCRACDEPFDEWRNKTVRLSLYAGIAFLTIWEDIGGTVLGICGFKCESVRICPDEAAYLALK